MLRVSPLSRTLVEGTRAPVHVTLVAMPSQDVTVSVTRASGKSWPLLRSPKK